jgi:curli biogenesis system outer membrane secretion channel CsgG
MRFLSVFVGTALLVGPAIGQPKRSLAINPFDYSTVMTDVQAIFGTQVDVGHGISALLVKRVAQSGKFTVVERQKVDALLQEQDFGASGRVKQGTQARTGQIRGADYILMGDIVTFGRDDKRKSAGVGGIAPGAGGVAGISKSDFKAVVTLNFRMVDAETSEIIMSGEARGESKRTSKGGFAGLLVGGIGVGGFADFSSSNFAETIIGEAVIDAADKLSEQINNQAGGVATGRNVEIQGLVAAVQGGQVYINVGSSSGVQIGDHFAVSEIVQEVRDPNTKEVLDVVTRPLGTLVITMVRDKIAIGSFSGAVPPKVGARVERK